MLVSEAIETSKTLSAQGILRPAKKQGYICPFCGSGSGKNGTGADHIEKGHGRLHCFSCGQTFDLVDGYAMERGLYDKRQGNPRWENFCEALQRTLETAGVVVGTLEKDGGGKTPPPSHHYEARPAVVKQREEQPPAPLDEPWTADEWKKLHAAAVDCPYLKERGISSATIKRFLGIGYDHHAIPYGWHEKDGRRFCTKWDAVIFRTSTYTWTMRNTHPKGDKDKKSGNKSTDANGVTRDELKKHLWNPHALEQERPVFVMEGVFDALSVAEAGGEAVALQGTAVSVLETVIKQRRAAGQPVPIIIEALDNDGAGRAAANDMLRPMLKKYDVPCISGVQITGECKDANEALMHDRTAFIEAVKEAEQMAVAEIEKDKEQLKQQEEETSVFYALDSIRARIKRRTPFCSTGFPTLDKVLGGGLYDGLYVVGAISSLGKTTFCLQVADQVAAAGQDVLFFSLEMSADELVSKTISRLTHQVTMDAGESAGLTPKTTQEIYTGSFYSGFTQSDRDTIEMAFVTYQSYCKNMYIVQGRGSVGMQQIRERVQQHVERTGRRPLVVVDYLQIIATADPHYTDKQKTDVNVVALKHLSEEFEIPVLCISSFNRENYTAPVSTSAFKETGNVEYSADVLIGLQYNGMGRVKGESDKTRAARVYELMENIDTMQKQRKPVDIDLRVLKARKGPRIPCIFKFVAAYNHFWEDPFASSPANQQECEDIYHEGENVRKDEPSQLNIRF